MNNTKHGLSIRGDSLYCPLSFSLDSYWNCLTGCFHCYFRKLNEIWGKELRPTNPEALEKKLINGLKNKNPISNLAWCLKNKKTIRVGNKSDPYQKIELKHKITTRNIKILNKLKWSYVIQTRFTQNMLELSEDDILIGNVVIMPVVSPGLEYDWETFERKRTTNPIKRLDHIQYLQKKGVKVGVNGEPFIPGVHTIQNFEDTIKLMKSKGLKSYNTYNFHFNDYVAKRLHANTKVDIEKIWYQNQDTQWKPVLQKLIDIAKKYNIKLGCPDFVNTGKYYKEPANTCCGIDVENPTMYNTHNWKRMKQDNKSTKNILKRTWDGVGDFKQGIKIIKGKSSKFYTLKDAGVL